jgi:MOSC domain-containing protein
MARIQAIYRYPVKGLSAEPLPRTALTTGETVPGDRLYAIENGPSGFDPATPSYLAKQHFLMLMRNERLAKLRTIFDHSSHTLSLAREGREVARGDLRTQDGRAAVERYFAEFCADELRGPPKILHAPGHSFSDVARKVVSIINLDSLAALADVVRAPVDPLRFRANVYVAGWPVWSELDSAQRTMRLTTLSRVQGPTAKTLPRS